MFGARRAGSVCRWGEPHGDLDADRERVQVAEGGVRAVHRGAPVVAGIIRGGRPTRLWEDREF